MRRYSSRSLPGGAPYRPGDLREPANPGAARTRSFDPREWEKCEDYLHGIDLFNRGYWWEAHEVFEDFWRAAGRGTPLGDFFQGLIQVAAALLKHAVGSGAAAGTLARSGCAKLRSAPGIFLGVDRDRLAASVEAFVSGESGVAPLIHLDGADPT